MNFEDTGFLINKTKYNENSAIVDFFTKNNGKVTGIIFGATSVKLKNYLLVGNQFSIQYNSKNPNRIGYFKVEVDKIFTPFFLENKIKLSCILYSLNLIKILTVEYQSNENIYNQFLKLYELLNQKDWFKKFIFWELEVIKLVGYDINFNEYTDNNKVNGSYTLSVDGLKKIPNFLLDKNLSEINLNELKDGFKIVGDFLNKSVLIPNNINFPILRNEFLKLI